jgi:hypothetical protein
MKETSQLTMLLLLRQLREPKSPFRSVCLVTSLRRERQPNATGAMESFQEMKVRATSDPIIKLVCSTATTSMTTTEDTIEVIKIQVTLKMSLVCQMINMSRRL